MPEHIYSYLSPDVVIDAVESLGVFSDGRILALNSYENRVYQVGIEDAQPVIVKFYRPNRWTREQIQEEHDFGYELQAEEWPIVTAWRNEQQQSVFELTLNDQTCFFSMYERKGGRAPELDNFEHLFTLGQYLAKLHNVSQRKDFQYRERLSVETFGYNNAQFLLENFVPKELTEAYESLTRDLLKLIDEKFALCNDAKFIRCHGDCHLGNILWRDDAPNFVDLDDTLMGPAIQDIWMLLSGDQIQQQQQLEEVIEGYELFREFDHKEFALIEPLRTLRMIKYAAWLAKRWDDPAFQTHFPWFNTERYWGEHILQLREQFSALQSPTLKISGANF